MRFKNKVLTFRGKLYTAILIIVCIFLAYLFLFHPPPAEAIKTMEIELGDVGGVYDGKVKLYRDTDNVLVLLVDSIRVEVDDNDITIDGKLIYRADGTDVAVPDGGTGKSSGTQYAIPYYNTTASFGEIPIGTAGKLLAVNSGANGYEWLDAELDPWENVLIVAKSGGDYTTIQAAIDAAASGDVILIAPGIYDETINWSAKSNVHLLGMSRDSCIITRNFAQPGAAGLGDGTFNWSNSNASIQNLTIRNTGAAPAATIALYLGSGTKYIRNCVFYGAGRDIVTLGSGTNYFDDCRIYNTDAAHVVWIYNGTNTFTDCEIKSDGTVVQFTTLAYSKTGSFYNSSIKCTGSSGYVFDLVHGNNTLIVDNCLVQAGGASPMFYRTLGTINLGRVVGEDNNAVTFTMLKNADSAFQSINVGTATGAGMGDGKFSGDVFIGGNDITFGHGEGINNNTDGTIEVTAAFKVSAAATQNVAIFESSTDPRFIVKDTGGAGNASVCAFEFKDSNDVRRAFIGDGSSSNDDVYIIADTGGVRFHANGALRLHINENGDTSANGQKMTAKIFDVQNYSGGKPAAAVAYRGQIVLEEGGVDVEDKLWICLKDWEGVYRWVDIAHGRPEP